jgi:hypothetical protein
MASSEQSGEVLKRSDSRRFSQRQKPLRSQYDQRGEAIDGFSEVDGFGIEIDFFDFGVGTHHEVLALERNREHSIRDQRAALNVGFMERLHLSHIDTPNDNRVVGLDRASIRPPTRCPTATLRTTKDAQARIASVARLQVRDSRLAD